MSDLLYFYQHIPLEISPIAFSVGFFSVRWYAVMYLIGFSAIYYLLIYRIKNGEVENLEIPNAKFQIPNKTQNTNFKYQTLIFELLLHCFIGLLIGARLGYVLFYNPEYYLIYPLEIIWPFDQGGNFTGIYGMSYFGGLAGTILAGYYFARKNNIDFLKLADFVVPAVPAGYFFGRIGNFLNGELYGKITEKPWGMNFGDGFLRHPSQLYEALFEGIILFAALWAIRNKTRFGGQNLFVYLAGYGFLRFFLEFFREPDPQPGLICGWLTVGQIFSLLVMIMSLSLYIFRWKGYNKSNENGQGI